MNKRKAYWSVMGVEPDTEPSSYFKRKLKHKKLLKNMISEYNHDGFNEIASLLREIYEENIV